MPILVYLILSWLQFSSMKKMGMEDADQLMVKGEPRKPDSKSARFSFPGPLLVIVPLVSASLIKFFSNASFLYESIVI